MKAKFKRHLLLVLLINAAFINIAHANEEVDAEFLEFLAEMEEVTGSGFDRWLEDDSEDINLMNTKAYDQYIQSKDNENH